MKCYYLLLLCIPLCLEVNALDEAKLTLLHDAVNEGAVCLDGTAPGYYMRKGEVHVCTMYIHTYYIYIYIYITLRLKPIIFIWACSGLSFKMVDFYFIPMLKAAVKQLTCQVFLL